MLPLMLVSHLILAEPPGDWFEFAMPALDSTPTYIDLSWLNPRPAGADGWLAARDGHFVDQNGERVRLFGTNLTFGGAFITHDTADKLAARLRKLGVNVVRLHHLDNQGPPRGLWASNEESRFDPEMLDRLCYLITQLGRHGIYTNLNLHVSRNYPGIDFAALPRTFNYGKSIDNYHPRLIELQKQYATALLTHVNPYSGVRLADDPAICILEINNENTLLGQANNAELLALPDDLRAPLEAGWRAWVAAKYGDLAAATRAWLRGVEPLGDELLTNGDLADGTTRWSLEAPPPAEATMVNADGILRATMTQPGAESWHFQIHQTGLDLADGSTYTVTFRARADAARQIRANVRLDQADWHMCGLDVPVNLTAEWTEHRFVFTASRTVPGHCRLSFTLGNLPGTIELDDLSLRRGAELALADGTTLETLPMPIGSGFRPLRIDWLTYIGETEKNYVEAMREHLRGLGCKAMIIDSQASYGGLGGIVREGELSDFVDMHAYWQHPHFPNRPWDGNDWRIDNTSMTAAADTGTLLRLGAHRVAGLPFTVSEYDHPAPSFYTAEMWPMLASIAALQDWDGLFQFDWASSEDSMQADRITGYFSAATNPAKIATMPLAALLFRAGLVPAAEQASLLEIPRGGVAERLADSIDAPRAWLAAGAEPRIVAQRRIGVRLVDGDGPPMLRDATPRRRSAAGGAAGAVSWQTDPPLFSVAAERVAIATGALAGRETTVGPLTVVLDDAPMRHATIGLLALDEAPLARSRKLLLTIIGAAQNTQMGWRDDFLTVGSRWGSGPTRLQALRGTATIATPLPGLTVSALDATGAPAATVPSRSGGGTLSFAVDPAHRAVWYAVAAR